MPIELKDDEIEVDTFTNASHIVAIQLKHLPTNISVWGKGERIFRLKRELRIELEKRVNDESTYVNGKW